MTQVLAWNTASLNSTVQYPCGLSYRISTVKRTLLTLHRAFRAGHDYGCANSISGSGTVSILVLQVLLALMHAYDVCAPIGW